MYAQITIEKPDTPNPGDFTAIGRELAADVEVPTRTFVRGPLVERTHEELENYRRGVESICRRRFWTVREIEFYDDVSGKKLIEDLRAARRRLSEINVNPAGILHLG